MTDQQLAKALFEAGLLTKEQITTAAAQRSGGRNFAQSVVNLGYLSSDRIKQFDRDAFNQTYDITSAAATTQTAQRFPAEAFEQPVISSPPSAQDGFGAPPIPSPYARLPHTHQANHTYQPYDSTRLLFYSIIGAFGCGLAAILCFFYSLDGLGKVQSGRIDPAHKTKISISLGLNIFGIVLVVMLRLLAANLRHARP